MPDQELKGRRFLDLVPLSASHTSRLRCRCPAPPPWGSTPNHEATQRSHVLNGSLFLSLQILLWLLQLIARKERRTACRMQRPPNCIVLTDDFSATIKGSHTFLEHSRGHGKGKRGALSFPSLQTNIFFPNFWATKVRKYIWQCVLGLINKTEGNTFGALKNWLSMWSNESDKKLLKW